MQRMTNVSDNSITQAGAICSAGASLLSCVQEWALALLGVPIGVPLGCLAGVLYGLSFREPMRPAALTVNVLGCTVFGSVVAPLGSYVFMPSAPVAVLAGLATIIGFLTQYVQPWLKSRRDAVLDRTADKLFGLKPRGKNDNDDGDFTI